MWDFLICSCETFSRQYDKYFIRRLNSMDHGLLCKPLFNVFPALIVPIIRVFSILSIVFISSSDIVLLSILF